MRFKRIFSCTVAKSKARQRETLLSELYGVGGRRKCIIQCRATQQALPRRATSKHRSFSWLASTWTQVRGAILVDLRLENKSSSCHAMHILHVDTQSRYSSGFVVVL